MASALYRGLSVAGRRVATRPSTASLLLQQQERATAGNFLVRAWFASYPPHELVGMPSLSPTMEAGTIASWNKQVGESFSAGDSLCSVETDKATVDFEAQDDGVVAKILAEAGGGEIKCGTPILITVEKESDVAAFANYVVEASTAAPTPAAPTPAPAATPAPTPAPVAPTPTPAAAPAPATAPGGRAMASPLAHMIAKEMGFDLSKIPGTGPGGRVIAADVKEFVPAAATTVAALTTPVAPSAPAPAQAVMASAAPIPGAGYTDYPLSESAKEVAARLTQSKQRVPHYYLTVDITMDEVLKLRSSLALAMSTKGGESTLGVYELMIKAAAASMKAVPSVNASWMDSVVRMYDSIDINVVVGTGDNLYTPVIRDCGGRGLSSISDALNAAVSVLEEGDDAPALTPSFGAMGTFTIMNLGMFGIKSCAPIIREPQACALALGALENRIVPNDDPKSDEIYKQSVVMTATLSCDHRVVDGAVGAQWLSAFKSHLENPTTLLL